MEEARKAKAEQEAANCRGLQRRTKAEAAEVEACSDEMAWRCEHDCEQLVSSSFEKIKGICFATCLINYVEG